MSWEPWNDSKNVRRSETGRSGQADRDLGLEHSAPIDFLAEDQPQILLATEHFFLVSKPPGWHCSGEDGLGKGDTPGLHHWLATLAWYGARGAEPRLAHRLDKDTSGIIVVARNAEVQSLY